MEYSLSYAQARDEEADDQFKNNINSFLKPKGPYQGKAIYLLGHSLGLPCKQSELDYKEALDNWKNLTEDPNLESSVRKSVAQIIGSNENEIAMAASLTQCMHIVFSRFYKPNGNRTKIYIDAPSFPSDIYAVKSCIERQNLDVDSNLILQTTREDEQFIRTQDILDKIDEEGDQIFMMFFQGINYLTGQFYDIQAITKQAHLKGIIVGWDLAHAIGNVPLEINNWDVDFATFCTYKFLNSGPHNNGGLYVNQKHHIKDVDFLQGFFSMDQQNLKVDGQMFYLQPPNQLLLSFMKAPFQLVAETGMNVLRARSIQLTEYLELCLRSIDPNEDHFVIISQKDVQRGSTISIFTKIDSKELTLELKKIDILVDCRRPSRMRIGPNAMYNTFTEIYLFCENFKKILGQQ